MPHWRPANVHRMPAHWRGDLGVARMSLPLGKPTRREIETPPASVLMLERHFSIEELAEMWSVSRDYIASLFVDEPGIIRSPRKKTGTVRIPASVVERVYKSMMQAGK